MAGPIRISILANASQARREIQSTTGVLGGVGKYGRAAGLALAGGVALAGAAAVKFAADTVKSASNAQQSLGATETVFGKFANKVISTSDKAAKAYGLSANEYRENANILGSLFKGQGVSTDQLAGKTQKMIGQAADLAATFGGTTKDAVGALGSAFKGEFDPLERYGISIKQSDINARLAAKGQDKLTGSALKLAKQVATTELINKQAAQTSGAFRKETNTLAHQQQVLGAQFENVKAKVGAALLPILTKFLTFLNKNLGPAFQAVGNFIAPLVAKFQGLFSSVGGGAGKLAPVVGIFRTFGAFLTGTVVPAIAALAAYVTGKLVPLFVQWAQIIATNVVPIVLSLASFVTGTLVPAVVAIATKVATSLKPVFDQLAATFQARVLPAVQAILAKFREWLPTIQKVVTVVVAVVGWVLKLAAAILGKVLPPLIRFAGFLIGTVVTVVLKVIGVLVKIVAAVIKVGGAIIDGARKFSDFANKVDAAVRRALAVIGGIAGKVKDALAGAGGWLLNAGKEIIGGLIRGIDSMIGTVTSKLKKLTSLIPKVKGPPAKDRRLLYRNGQLIIAGLVRGFDSQAPAVKRALAILGDEIATFSATPAATVRLSAADALTEAASAELRQSITVKLTAQQLSALQRGREIKADLDAYTAAGGKR